MRSIVPISALLLCALTLLPAVSFAEVISATTEASAETSGTIKTPVATHADSYSFGASNPTSMGTGGHGAGKMAATGTRPVEKAIEERMQERDAMHAKLVGSGAVGRGEVRQNMTKERIEIFARFSTTIIGRMNAAINRLKKIADRLDSRIAKEKARGVDTTKAEANVAIARVKIADAETAVSLAANIVSTASANINMSSTTTKPSDIGKPVREALAKAREAVFAAHKSLVDAISSLTAVVAITSDELNGDTKPHAKATSSTTVSGSASTEVTH